MSYRVGTTHYNLPLTEGNDKRDWADTNQAFEDLDAAVYEAASDSSLAISAAQTAQTSADGAVADAATAVSTANAAASQAATASELASLARTEAQSAVTTAQSAQTTAQSAQTTATNADTVALAARSNIGTMSDLQTTDKSSLVAAINEVLSQIGGGGMRPLDMSNKVQITTTGYTPNVDGALFGYAGVTTGSQAAVLSVDGEAVARATNTTPCSDLYFPISAGQVIALDRIPEANGIKFAPYL